MIRRTNSQIARCELDKRSYSTGKIPSLSGLISKYESLIFSVHTAFEGEYKRGCLELQMSIQSLKDGFASWKSNLLRRKKAVLSSAITQRALLKMELEKKESGAERTVH